MSDACGLYLTTPVGVFACGRPYGHPGPCAPTSAAVRAKLSRMHYRNGREAKNGDKVIQIGFDGKLQVGVLYDAVAGNDYCNGSLAPVPAGPVACLIDCLHVDDVMAILAEKGLDKRPPGK